ncbi:MAG: hypothetical protein Q8O93_01395 [bacterium]|nr:hypothetical protein [bacterium]
MIVIVKKIKNGFHGYLKNNPLFKADGATVNEVADKIASKMPGNRVKLEIQYNNDMDTWQHVSEQTGVLVAVKGQFA